MSFLKRKIFLSKHLLIDWRWGEAYFAEKLNDYDLSANNGNWQWVAGSGCDAAPYLEFSIKIGFVHAVLPSLSVTSTLPTLASFCSNPTRQFVNPLHFCLKNYTIPISTCPKCNFLNRGTFYFYFHIAAHLVIIYYRTFSSIKTTIFECFKYAFESNLSAFIIVHALPTILLLCTSSVAIPDKTCPLFNN